MPGVGKSDSVKQFAQGRAKDLGLDFYEGPENYDPEKFGFFDLRLATVDSIDLNGLPLIKHTTESEEDAVTKFTRSPYIAKDGHGVLFLDELPQAKQGNQAAISQLILDKRVGTHALGPNWLIIAAGNRTQDRAATHKMPTHIANRLTALDLEFNLEQFIAYMHNEQVHEAAVAFAKFRPDILESFKPDEDVNCTPRSFIAASRYIDTPDNIQFNLMAGTIGEGAAAEFLGFNKIYLNLPPLQDFLDKPKKIKIPEEADILFATIQMLSHNTTVENIEHIAKFIDRLHETPERQIQYYRAAVVKTPSINQTQVFSDFVIANRELVF
jgi:hypothetical protein